MIFAIRNVRKHKKFLVVVTLKGHVQSFTMFCMNTISSQQEKEQLLGRFSAIVQIYQSRLGESSLPKGNQPHNHICMSLQLDWAFGANRQPSFLTKLPVM